MKPRPLASAWLTTTRVVLLVYLGLVPVVFWRGGLEPFESCKAVLLHLAGLVLLGCLICAGVWRELLSRSEPIGLALLAGLLAAVLSTLASVSPRTSLWGAWENHQGLLSVASLLVVFLATRAVFRRAEDVGPLLAALAIGVSVCAGYALVQVLGRDPLMWVETSVYAGFTRPIGTLGHPNYLAGFLVMALPLLLCGGRPALLPAVLAGVVILASLSRAAWLAAGCLLVLPLLGGWGGRRRWWIAAGLFALAGILVGLAGAGLLGPLGQRLRHFGDSSVRLTIWQISWRMFLDHPLLGSGLDTFQLAFARHRTLHYWSLEWGMTPGRAHNDLLQVLATQGLVGALALLAQPLAVLLAARRAWRLRPGQQGLVLGLVGVVLAYYVQNVFGFPVIATSSLLAVALGCLSRLGEAAQTPAGSPLAARPCGWLRPALTWPVVLVLAVTVAGCPFRAWCLVRQGQTLLASDPDRAMAAHERAAAIAPWLDLTHSHLAASRHRAALVRGDGDLLRRAEAAARTAREQVPANPVYHANHARMLADLARRGERRPEDAWQAYDEALARDPCNLLTWADAAGAAISLGQYEQGRHYLAVGLALEPTFPHLVAERGVLALAEGRLEDAERDLRVSLAGDWHEQWEAAGRARGLLALTYLKLGRPINALAQADDVLVRHPGRTSFEAATRWVRAAALEQLGHRQLARDDLELLLVLRPDYAPARESLRRLQEK